MKNFWARTEKERRRCMKSGSQEVLRSVYIVRNSEKLADTVNHKKLLGGPFVGHSGEITEL